MHKTKSTTAGIDKIARARQLRAQELKRKETVVKRYKTPRKTRKPEDSNLVSSSPFQEAETPTLPHPKTETHQMFSWGW